MMQDFIGPSHPKYEEEKLEFESREEEEAFTYPSVRIFGVDEDGFGTGELGVTTTTGEVRVTSKTGGQKGSKLARYDLIPTEPLKELAEHYGKGAEKYEKVNGVDNWRNGYDWSLSYAALNRHLGAFWSGEDIDEETGSYHLVAVAWHAFTMLYFLMNERYEQFDDRQDKIMNERDE